MPWILCKPIARKRLRCSRRSFRTKRPRWKIVSNWPACTWRRGIGFGPATNSCAIVTSQGTEPRYLIAYIDALLDHGETKNAELYLERLQKLSPNLIDTVALQARMLVLKNEPYKALELLKEFIERPTAQPLDRSVRIRGVASLLDHLSRQLSKPAEKPIADRLSRQAEIFYRLYLKKNPGHESELVAFLSRQGRTDEALDLFDRMWANSNPMLINQTCELMIERTMGVNQMDALAAFLRQPCSVSTAPPRY